MGIPATSGLPRSRWPIFTTCAKARRLHGAATRTDQDTRHGTAHRRAARAPEGRPGFIRIEAVHQGDQDGLKGVYQINVDCLTQCELAGELREAERSVLVAGHRRAALGLSFPHPGRSRRQRLAVTSTTELRVEFTKSRPRHSNDNGLAETKNAALVCKHFGYAHIPQRFAAELTAFYTEHLHPYLNFHRLCLFAEEIPDPKRRRQCSSLPQSRHQPGGPARSGAGALGQRGRRAAQPSPPAGVHFHPTAIPQRCLRLTPPRVCGPPSCISSLA
jgi:hypothetical protein